jgi:chemosensory pili system protein ChpC
VTLSATDLKILILPAPGADLLLPAGAVAEIVRGQDLGPPPEGVPDWIVGALAWRGHTLSVARLAQASASGGRPDTVVVCFAPGRNPALPYLAIESPRLPRLEQVSPDHLAPEGDTPEGVPWFVREPLRLKGNPAWLLDLGAMERLLLG